MNRQIIVSFLFFLLFLSPFGGEVGAKKNLDPYKVLGVDRSASQRDIQKAFHKLSLQYHPDKNKNKGAQEKFSEINNAYEILSDEDKKKNYDLYGDESVGAGFNSGSNFGGQEGYSYFTSGGHGWKIMGKKGNSFSFSYGGNPGADGSFGFRLSDIFSNFFGDTGQGGNPFESFGGFSWPRSGTTSRTKLKTVNTQTYKQEIVDQGLTWLLLFYAKSSKDLHMLESTIEDVSDSLQGAIKAGSINCQTEQSLCNNLGVWPSKLARVFCYSHGSGMSGSLVEYTSDMDSRSLKSFCQDQLPRFSERVTLNKFDFTSYAGGGLPQVLLLSTKKHTPVIWRTMSGLYRKRFVFLDAEAHDVTDKTVKQLGVEALPAVVGRLANGEVQVLKAGFAVKDLKAGVSEISSLLDSFEKRNKKVASNQANKHSTDSYDKGIPHLMSSNMDSLCGDKTTLCIIGAFKSSKAKDRLEAILTLVSQKTLIRQPTYQNLRNLIQYVLLDADKQSTFLKSFDKSVFKNSDKLLLAYKPRKGKFAAFTNEITLEETEEFISSVLNGDIQFHKVKRKPVFN